MNILYEYGNWYPDDKDSSFSLARRNKITGTISIWSSGESLFQEIFGTWTDIKDCPSYISKGKFLPQGE